MLSLPFNLSCSLSFARSLSAAYLMAASCGDNHNGTFHSTKAPLHASHCVCVRVCVCVPSDSSLICYKIAHLADAVQPGGNYTTQHPACLLPAFSFPSLATQSILPSCSSHSLFVDPRPSINCAAIWQFPPRFLWASIFHSFHTHTHTHNTRRPQRHFHPCTLTFVSCGAI